MCRHWPWPNGSLDEWVAKRREIFEKYKQELSNINAISFLEEPDNNYYANRWLTTILVDPKNNNGVNRETIRLALEKQNIESRPLWKPMHLQPIFKDYPYYGAGLSQRLFMDGLCLPSGSNMTNEQQDRIIKKIKLLFN